MLKADKEVLIKELTDKFSRAKTVIVSEMRKVDVATVTKLRKKLRNHLGYDPIESKRYMGYRLDDLKSRNGESGPSSPIEKSWTGTYGTTSA